MIYDGHIHQHYSCPDDPADFMKAVAKCGIGGGNVIRKTDGIRVSVL